MSERLDRQRYFLRQANMTSHRWQKVKSAYLEASDLGEAERESFLARLRQMDLDLAEAVRELLSGPLLDAAGQSCWLATQNTQGPRLLETGACLAGRFDVLSYLGGGGAGEVYCSRDRDQGGLVALKVLRPQWAGGENAQLLLRSELQVARMVTHPNVCRLHEFYPARDGSPPFLTMELLEGSTLLERLSFEGRYGLPQARPFVDQILDGLEAAHSKGIVHRDLKSANIMVTKDPERVVLMDFGLARDVQPGPDLA